MGSSLPYTTPVFGSRGECDKGRYHTLFFMTELLLSVIFTANHSYIWHLFFTLIENHPEQFVPEAERLNELVGANNSLLTCLSFYIFAQTACILATEALRLRNAGVAAHSYNWHRMSCRWRWCSRRSPDVGLGVIRPSNPRPMLPEPPLKTAASTPVEIAAGPALRHLSLQTAANLHCRWDC